jgi:hypothetical protein
MTGQPIGFCLARAGCSPRVQNRVHIRGGALQLVAG